jgi:hypothetical protein
MRTAGDQAVLIRDEHFYHAHPHMAVLGSGSWLLVANRAPRRRVTMHPPQDPDFVNVLIRSDDEGATWSPPAIVPAYGWTGMECAGLTPLGGARVLINQWRFRWYPYTAAPSRADEPLLVTAAELKSGLLASTEIADPRVADVAPERLMPWARGGGATFAHVSADAGATWSAPAEIATAPYVGGYGMRGGIVVDGEILLPLSDIPHYRDVFLVRSGDGGRTWGPPRPVAALPACEFEEPAPLLLADGTILLLLRENVSRTLFAVRSGDAGRTWSAPRPTGMDLYPAHLLALPDGRIAAVVGRRHPPFGIEIRFSRDKGASFDRESPLTVVTGLPNKDLGYPTAALRSDGTLFVAHYHRDAEGVTGIHATLVAL